MDNCYITVNMHCLQLHLFLFASFALYFRKFLKSKYMIYSSDNELCVDVVVWMCHVPIGSCVWTSDPYLVVQYGKAVEPSEGEALLGKVSY